MDGAVDGSAEFVERELDVRVTVEILAMTSTFCPVSWERLLFSSNIVEEENGCWLNYLKKRRSSRGRGQLKSGSCYLDI